MCGKTTKRINFVCGMKNRTCGEGNFSSRNFFTRHFFSQDYFKNTNCLKDNKFIASSH